MEYRSTYRTKEEKNALIKAVETRVANGECQRAACRAEDLPEGTFSSTKAFDRARLTQEEWEAKYFAHNYDHRNPGPIKRRGPGKKNKAQDVSFHSLIPKPKPVLHEITVRESSGASILDSLPGGDKSNGQGNPMVVLIGHEATITRALDSLAQMWSKLNG